MRLLPYGDDALLAEVDSTEHALALHRALAGMPEVVESVPAARTVLAVFGPGATDRESLLRRAAATARYATTESRPPVEVPTRYDGADLESTAAEVGCAPADLAARHAAVDYVVGFCGFSPGFAYLTGLPPDLHVPRLPTPRTRVPAGSVAIAGEFAGVYPRESPGGWRLLGRTDAAIWDAARTPPALLTPGTRVRFVPT